MRPFFSILHVLLIKALLKTIECCQQINVFFTFSLCLFRAILCIANTPANIASNKKKNNGNVGKNATLSSYFYNYFFLSVFHSFILEFMLSFCCKDVGSKSLKTIGRITQRGKTKRIHRKKKNGLRLMHIRTHPSISNDNAIVSVSDLKQHTTNDYGTECKHKMTRKHKGDWDTQCTALLNRVLERHGDRKKVCAREKEWTEKGWERTRYR